MLSSPTSSKRIAVSGEVATKPRYRLGVDVGGTHTDLVLLDTASGILTVEKVASTPGNPALGVLMDWADQAAPEAGEPLSPLAQRFRRARP